MVDFHEMLKRARSNVAAEEAHEMLLADAEKTLAEPAPEETPLQLEEDPSPTIPVAANDAPAADPLAPVVVIGEVVYVVFASGENGFRVLRVKLDDGKNAVVAGRCSAFRVGERIRAIGQWRMTKRGLQLQSDSISALEDVTDRGLAKSLDGLVPGLGIGRASRLVDALGGSTRTIEALDRAIGYEDQDEALEALYKGSASGLTWLPYQVRCDLIAEWRKSRVEREVEARLASLDLSAGLRARLVARFGADAARIVLKEPYRLTTEIDGVGFLTADDVAVKVGVGRDSEERIDAAVLHVLRLESEDGGHTVSGSHDVARALFALFMERPAPRPFADDPEQTVQTSLRRLLKRGAIAIDGRDESSRARICLPNLLEAEREIATDLRAMLAAERPPLEYAGVLDPKLTDEQKFAVLSVFDRGVLVLTGGPGVGKTFTCQEIVRTAEKLGLKVALCAPTARAAKRLGELTGRDAVTIHRLLEAKGADRFDRHRGNPIAADLVIADESSMVDVQLMRALVSSVGRRARLVLCGDKDQLPPVGEGAPFRDVIASGVVPVARLTKIHRQASGSAIVRVAHGVLRGATPCPSPPGDRTDGCLHLVQKPSDQTPSTVVDVVLGLRDELGIDPWDAMVLAPMRKGACGVAALNTMLQEAMNPSRGELEIVYGREDNKRTFRVGDKVRQTKNDYERGVVNGDVGRIVEIFPEKERSDGRPWLSVDFAGVGVVRYDGGHLSNLVLAYCNTIHSAQGGQGPAVVLVMVDQHYVMLTRTLLYTAVTRAEHACLIVGSRRAIETAARNAKDDARRTNLRRLLERSPATHGDEGGGRV